MNQVLNQKQNKKYQDALEELSFPLVSSDCGGCKCGESDCSCEKSEAVETLQELVDKATPKKPLNIKDENLKEVGGKSRYGSFITGSCPNCKHDVQLGMNYCFECGQAINWGEDDE